MFCWSYIFICFFFDRVFHDCLLSNTKEGTAESVEENAPESLSPLLPETDTVSGRADCQVLQRASFIGMGISEQPYFITIADHVNFMQPMSGKGLYDRLRQTMYRKFQKVSQKRSGRGCGTDSYHGS